MVSIRTLVARDCSLSVWSSRNLQESYQLLKPIANMFSMRYGSVVTIFMAAPHENGEIETQRYARLDGCLWSSLTSSLAFMRGNLRDSCRRPGITPTGWAMQRRGTCLHPSPVNVLVRPSSR